MIYVKENLSDGSNGIRREGQIYGHDRTNIFLD
jgi:hypothetical protein